MLLGLEVGQEYLTNTHRIGSELSDVDRCLDGSTQLELVGLDRDDLHKRHLGDKLLGSGVVKGLLRVIPSGTLNIEALEISTLVESGCDFRSVMN